MPTRRARVRDLLGDVCASELGACRGVSGQYHQAPVPQIRKPKAEIRRKSEFRSPKHLSPWPGSSPLRQGWVRISSFGLPSDFGPLRPVVLTLLIRMLDKRGETQRRRDSQRFAESSSSPRFSAFLCTAICEDLRSPRKISWPHVTFATHLTHLTFWLRLGRAASLR